jgi:hypothetical protein
MRPFGVHLAASDSEEPPSECSRLSSDLFTVAKSRIAQSRACRLHIYTVFTKKGIADSLLLVPDFC